MTGRHLTPEQLVACRDHELDDREALEHLSDCRTCRERLSDTRMMTFYLRTGEKHEAAPHPGVEVLAAYLDGALARPDADAIEAHAGSCESCTLRLIHLRRSLRGRPEAEASPQLLESARRQLRTPHPRRPLGRALVEAAGKAWLRFRYLPEPADQEFAALPSAIEARPLEETRSLSAASSRRARLMARFHWGKSQPAEAPLMDELREVSLESDLESTLEVDAGPVRLTLAGRRGRPGAELTICARNAVTKDPVASLELTLIPAHEAPLTVTTDAQGCAVIALQRGESRLRIYVDPVSELILRYS